MRKVWIFIFLVPAMLLGPKANPQNRFGPWSIATMALQVLSGGPALVGFLQKSGTRGTDPAFVHGVLQGAHQLQERGLPPQAYLLKANEGLAKGVAPSRIRPALLRTRNQTQLAGSLVREGQSRGWVFQNPRQQRRTIQEFQWALMNQTPPSVLRSLVGQSPHPEFFPHAWKAWKAGKAGPPPWAGVWQKPGKGKKYKNKGKIGPKGKGPPGWSRGRKGKNKGKF